MMIITALLACGTTREARPEGEPPTADPTAQEAPPAPERDPPPVQEVPHRDGVIVTNPQGLCADGEVVYFSCPLEQARLVSLCGTDSLSGEGAALQLRVGRSGSLEVSLPPAPEDSVDVFEGATAAGAMAVRLSTGRLGFEIFQEATGAAGLTHVAPNGIRTDENCMSSPYGGLENVIGEVVSISYWR